MKHTFRKLALVLLALVLLIGTFPAAAAGEGKITITNAQNGKTYKIYKILNLEFDAANSAYSYTIAEGWANLFSTEAATKVFTVADGYVTAKDPSATAAEVQAFAQAALAFASANGIAPTKTDTASGTSLVFDNLELGYYLVESNLGAMVALNTTAKEASITDKNEIPTIDKKINDEGSEVDNNSAQVGDTVNYKVTVHAKKGALKYKVTDTLSKGLTYNENSLSITGLTLNTDYTVSSSTDSPSGVTTLTILFTETYLNSLTEDKDIEISYSATLNAAAVEEDPSTNKAKLNYGRDGNEETTEKETHTKTHEFSILKTDSNAENPKTLAGAKFKLYRGAVESSAVAVNLLQLADQSYRPVVTGETGAETVTTPDTGLIKFVGLDADTYWLEETEAPGGYNKLTAKIKVVIAEDGAVTVTMNDTNLTVDSNNHQFNVVNNTGSELPSTGGMGTTIFYIVGGILMLVTLLVLVARRKTSAAK